MHQGPAVSSAARHPHGTLASAADGSLSMVQMGVAYGIYLARLQQQQQHSAVNRGGSSSISPGQQGGGDGIEFANHRHHQQQPATFMGLVVRGEEAVHAMNETERHQFWKFMTTPGTDHHQQQR